MDTPFFVTTFSPSTVPTTFPPLTDAMSTMTLPRFMPFTIASGIKTGAFLPGIKAVVITTSAFATSSVSMACSACLYSSDISFA